MRLRLLATLLIAFVCLGCGSNSVTPFKLYSIDGSKTFSLEDYKGKVLVLDFWATWCGPCKQYQPIIREWAEQYAKNGVTVLGVSNESPKVVGDFVAKSPLGYQAVIDRGDRVSDQFAVTSLPTLVILDRNGAVAFSGHPGDSQKVVDTLTRLSSGK